MWPFHRHDWKETGRRFGRVTMSYGIIGADTPYTGPVTVVAWECLADITHIKGALVAGDVGLEHGHAVIS